MESDTGLSLAAGFVSFFQTGGKTSKDRCRRLRSFAFTGSRYSLRNRTYRTLRFTGRLQLEHVEQHRQEHQEHRPYIQRHAGVREVRHQADHQHQERQRTVRADRVQPHLVFQAGTFAGAQAFAEFQLCQQDHHPGPDRAEGSNGGHPDEDFLRHQVVEQHADQQGENRQQQRPTWHAVGGLGETGRGLAVLRQAIEHAPGAEDAAVARRQRRRDHHEVDDAGGSLDAQTLEGHHERTALSADFVPRVDRQDHEQCADIEQQNAPEHRADRIRDGLLRVLRFTGGQADHLDTEVGEHDHLQGHQHTGHAVGHEAAVGPQVGNPQRHAVVAETERDDTDAADDHGDDGDDLDQGEPEFEFTEGFYRDQVDRAHADQRREGPDPARHIRKPDAHVHGDGGDFRDAGHQPQEPVVPAGEKTRERAEVVLGVAAERTGHRVVHGHFAEGAHDHQDRQTAENVGQHDGRTGHFNGFGRTQEQADTDTGAERHQANMPFTEFAFERAAVSGLAMGQVIADWHREQPRLVIGYDRRVSKPRPIGLSFPTPRRLVGKRV
ncbi:hypothetical protein EMIT0215P_70039 [Pseudomonas serboccidentalis]